MKKALKLFFVPVWRCPGKDPAYLCRECGLLTPGSLGAEPGPSLLQCCPGRSAVARAAAQVWARAARGIMMLCAPPLRRSLPILSLSLSPRWWKGRRWSCAGRIRRQRAVTRRPELGTAAAEWILDTCAEAAAVGDGADRVGLAKPGLAAAAVAMRATMARTSRRRWAISPPG